VLSFYGIVCMARGKKSTHSVGWEVLEVTLVGEQEIGTMTSENSLDKVHLLKLLLAMNLNLH
jgi:hypothetical protein